VNPTIRKELRQRLRDRRAWLFPSLYLLVLGGAVTLGYYWMVAGPESWFEFREPQGAEIGVAVYRTVEFTQMALLLLIAPVFSAGVLTIEKEQRTLPALLTSLLSPAEIWWGKFVASVLFLALLLVSALPVLALAFSLGGISPRDLLITEGLTLFILAVICAVGLYCSAFFKRSVHATAVTYGVVITLMVVTFVIFLLLTWQWDIYARSHPGATAEPDFLVYPLSLNPFYVLLVPDIHELEQHLLWLVPLLLYAAMGCLAAALALRNLTRAGEQS
jgi:ABC-2 type transport system permease protein